jgi:hypothetical protein
VRIRKNTPDNDNGREVRSRLRQQLARLRQERARLEGEMVALTRGRLVAGSLIVKYKRCNKGGCRCTRGEPHGPFWYVSQAVGGRTVMRFLRAAWVERVRAACGRARRWRRARARLVVVQQQILGVLDRLGALATMELERLVGKR